MRNKLIYKCKVCGHLLNEDDQLNNPKRDYKYNSTQSPITQSIDNGTSLHNNINKKILGEIVIYICPKCKTENQFLK